MKTNIFSVAALAVSAAAFTVMTAPTAHASEFECDNVMHALIKKNGGCPGDRCAFDVKNGELYGTQGDSSGRSGGVSKGDGYTETVGLLDYDKNNKQAQAISKARLEKSKTGQLSLKMELMTAKGKVGTREFVFAGNEEGCPLTETSFKGVNDLNTKVDYSRKFCDDANDAYQGFAKMTASEATACRDAMTALVSAYAKHSEALMKQDKVFRESTPGAVRASNWHDKGSKLDPKMAENALKQRDLCATEKNTVDNLRPDYSYLNALMNSRGGARIIDEYADKRATKDLSLPPAKSGKTRR